MYVFIKICISSGGYGGGPKNTILEFSYETETWDEIGAMKETRSSHAVSLMSYDVFTQFYAKWCSVSDSTTDGVPSGSSVSDSTTEGTNVGSSVSDLTSVFLLTGGSNNSTSSEIYNPESKTSCTLPKFLKKRSFHTQEGGLVCGGGSEDASQKSCSKWSPTSGTWEQSHTLRQQRKEHVSWAAASGVYLIGGEFSKKTSELAKVDGSVEEGFGLEYDTRLHFL